MKNELLKMIKNDVDKATVIEWISKRLDEKESNELVWLKHLMEIPEDRAVDKRILKEFIEDNID